MRPYSFRLFGAGITQLAECQLPKLNVAGSTPVTRSIILISLILLLLSVCAPVIATDLDFWLEISGSPSQSRPVPDWSQYSEYSLRTQVLNGNRRALIPLVCLLVSSGRFTEAEIWMDGRGMLTPVSRRDLGIALSWYGRFDLHGIVSEGTSPIPVDLQDDDYALTLAAVLSAGWMVTSPTGCFHPDMLVGSVELQHLCGIFFPSEFRWEKEWISIESLDSLFQSGTGESYPR